MLLRNIDSMIITFFKSYSKAALLIPGVGNIDPGEFSFNSEKPWKKYLTASWRPWLAASSVFD